MKKIVLSLAALLLLGGNLFAQKHRTCLTHDKFVEAMKDPATAARRAQVEHDIETYLNAHPQAASRTSGNQDILVTVPVVVHVLYYNSTQNISDAQIQTQIDVLNEDYAHRNPDSVNTPAVFQSLMANTEIQFCLASSDPSGNATTGIERRQVTVTQIGSTNKYYQYAQGGLTAWNRNYYLNIWICDIDGGFTLGFSYLPGTASAAYDGVVIDYNFFGTIGTAQSPFDLGRTATHEVGHWFNMEHIWADEPSCSADDGVTDTPQQKGENYGCPSYPQTTQSGGRCSTADPSSMYMNYMDYTDDACMNMFTYGQAARMQAAVNGARATLLTSTGCSIPSGISTPGGKLGMSVYPNPSAGVYSFSTGFFNGEAQLSVTDIAGRVVLEKTYQQGDQLIFDITDQPSGSYFVDVKIGDHREVKQVVKN